MGSATPRHMPRQAGVAGLVAILLIAAAVSWVLTNERMAGMDAGPGTELGSPGWFIVAWLTMMAAMMLPSAAPVLVAHATLWGSSGGRGWAPVTGASVVFVAGYLASWAAAGLFGYLIIEGVRSLDVGFLAWERAGRYVAGGVLLGAAVYELTPLKDACLRRCRSPMLPESSRSGLLGALRTGIEYGNLCIGCCWALMAALFALGVMNTVWMAFVAALVAAEKLAPWRLIASRGVALLLAVLAIALAFAPGDVPSLTVPGSSGAADSMDAMGAPADEGTMGTAGHAQPPD